MITSEYECSAVVSNTNFWVNSADYPGEFHVVFNDNHMEELVFYWKNSLKYKVDYFWRFSYAYTIN